VADDVAGYDVAAAAADAADTASADGADDAVVVEELGETVDEG